MDDTTEMDPPILQYNTFSSFVDSGFWHKFTQIKLNVDKLDGQRKKIWGSYTFQNDIGQLFEVNSTAFNSVPDIQRYECLSHGVILNKNTLEEFKDCDRVEILNNEGRLLWQDIQSNKCIENPSLLSRFFILSFADLKKYQYFYWFAFPVPCHPFVYLPNKPSPLTDVYTENQIISLIKSYTLLDIHQKQFFAINVNDNDTMDALPLASVLNEQYQILPNGSTPCFGYLDPSNNEFPGWVLRNFITLLTYKYEDFRGKNIMFLSLRLERNGCYSNSLIYNVNIPQNLEGDWGKNWVGWERNNKGNFGPRFANMASSMDPLMLAESSVDLNLKLMKWRLLPDIDLDVIKNQKCLLLGAGTLGCSVARNLLAWGVKTITFVDNGKVSFSNPVRQSLFMHEDCLNGGIPKALAAATNLHKIYPGVISKGIVMHIPMPGHPVGEALKESTINNINCLTELISSHDIIFMLLDSREGRWLPTLLAAHFKKLAINAALGFDSYLIMRHGIANDSDESQETTGIDYIKKRYISGNQLGCYFCNDVTAPGNSQKDRTLDQQCTVTRPGVANIAGALASEVAIAVTQHKRKIEAPAPYNCDGDFNDPEGILGAIPHTIRGFLTSYQQVLPSSGKFKQCIACSSIVINLYKTKGIEFLMDVFNSTKYLEDVTGLTELQNEANNTEMWALSESDED